jgi:hypothetical protein
MGFLERKKKQKHQSSNPLVTRFCKQQTREFVFLKIKIYKTRLMYVGWAGKPTRLGLFLKGQTHESRLLLAFSCFFFKKIILYLDKKNLIKKS